jgi:hypothetical protein
MKLKLLNDVTINNVDYAAINTINGQLTIGVCNINDFFNIYPLLSDEVQTETIQLMSEKDDVVNTFKNYTFLSLFSVNNDANNMVFWLRKKG